MKDKRVYFKILLMIFIFLEIIVMMGCSSSGGNTVSPLSPTPTPEPTPVVGKFIVSIKVPDWIDKIGDTKKKSFPYCADYYIVKITGESIKSGYEPIVKNKIVNGGLETINIENVPVGLNVAEIRVFSENNEMLAGTKKGYFQESTTKNLGIVYLGVSLKDGGSKGPIYEPQKIYVPYNSMLYFQNWKTSPQQVQLNKDDGAIEKIIDLPGAVSTSETNTKQAYPYKTLICNLDNGIPSGKYIFSNDQSSGGPGFMVVYDIPTISDIWVSTEKTGGDWPKEEGDSNYVDNKFGCSLYYTIAGDNLGENQAIVNGVVYIYKWLGNNWSSGVDISSDVAEWGNDHVSGVIPFSVETESVGKYRINIVVRDCVTQPASSTSKIFFLKGSGGAQSEIEESQF